jgi:hypothetical protein
MVWRKTVEGAGAGRGCQRLVLGQPTVARVSPGTRRG